MKIKIRKPIKYCLFVGANCNICNCGESFINEENLSSHLKNNHKTIKQEKVTFSKNEYGSQQSSIKKSTDESPSSSKKVVFKLTDQLFILDKENLEHDYNQLLPKAEVKQEYFCDMCGKSCDTEELVEEHKEYQHGQPKPNTTKPKKKRIQKKRVQKEFQCNVCGKTLKTATGKLYHRRLHSGERPYACHFCPKAFITKNFLDDHIRTHTGEQPFECHLCPKKYNKRTSLWRHLVVHSGIKRYVCPICPDKKFSTSDGLTQHRNIVHLKIYKKRIRVRKPSGPKKNISQPRPVKEEVKMSSDSEGSESNCSLEFQITQDSGVSYDQGVYYAEDVAYSEEIAPPRRGVRNVVIKNRAFC